MRFLFSFLLVIYCGLCFSQNLKEYQKLDSLAGYYFNKDLGKSYKYQKDALSIAILLNQREPLLNSYRSIASIEIELGEFTKAQSHLETAIEFAINSLDTANIYRKQGILYDELGEADQAISFLLSALELIADQDILMKKKLLNDLGLFYRNINEPQKALEFFNKKVALELSMNSPKIDRSYMNIGLIHLDNDHYDSAIYYFNQSYKYINKEEELFGVSLYHNNMGSALSDKGESRKALPHALKAIEIRKKLGRKQSLANTYNLLSFIYLNLKEYKNAEKFASTALSLQDSSGSNRVKYNSIMYLIRARLNKADTTGVEDLVQYLLDVEHDRYDKEKTAKFTEIASKYELKTKENNLLEANLELEKASNEIQRQTIFKNSLIVGIIVLIIISILIFRTQRLKTKANKLLAKKNSEIEALNEAKTRWLVNVSHELRTPLTLIKGPINQSVANEKINPKVKRDLLLAKNNLTILETLVDEILDLSKMESGKVLLQYQSINLSKLLTQILSAYGSQADQLKIEIKHQIQEDVFAKLDADKIFKAVTNLISNALKFTHEGGLVSLNLTVTANEILITVTDNGEGISIEDMPFVFDRYYQSSLEKKSRQGGTGIGLALTKEIVELHNGSLSVKSEIGNGSKFILILPSSLLTPAFEEENTPILEQPSEIEELIVFSGFEKGKPKLLLVDDNKDMRSFILSFMQNDYRIVEARDGLDAIQKLEIEKPDIIISDIMMPRMDGIEFIKAVKDHQEWKKIPFISLTALARESDKIYTLQIGVDDYIIKPFNPIELKVRAFNLINNAIERKNIDVDEEEIVSYQDELIEKLKTTVEHNLSEKKFNISRLADVAAMSERQLHRTVKQISGLTPGQFVREIRLQKAMTYLEHSKFATMSELAHAVGFEQPGYFSAVFEKRFGSKPTAYM